MPLQVIYLNTHPPLPASVPHPSFRSHLPLTVSLSSHHSFHHPHSSIPSFPHGTRHRTADLELDAPLPFPLTLSSHCSLTPHSFLKNNLTQDGWILEFDAPLNRKRHDLVVVMLGQMNRGIATLPDLSEHWKVFEPQLQVRVRPLSFQPL